MTKYQGVVSSLVCLLFSALAHSQQNSQDTSWLRPQFQTNTHIREQHDAVNVPGKPLIATSKAYQICVAPGGKPGHCKHMSACSDKSFGNFYQAANYMCVIEKEFIGICCPDDAANNDQNDVLPVGGLAGSLPAVATEGDDAVVLPGSMSSEADHFRRHLGCGYSTYETNRVVDGKSTNITTFPWMAAILGNPLKFHFCGGVLITDRHVLSAGHCLYKVRAKRILVRLGEYNLEDPEETRALDFNVTEIIMHPEYSDMTKSNDIAIIKLHRPTVFNTYIWPICLPPLGATFDHKTATVIGWGKIKHDGDDSNVLKAITVPVWSQNDCITEFVEEITPKHLCAAAYEGNGDSCQGDSGGPLMHRLSNGRWVTVGVVSWGIGCGDIGKPGIYTRVNAYLDWIFANAIF